MRLATPSWRIAAPIRPGLIKEEAHKHGINHDLCQKLRAMAALETGYIPDDLQKLYTSLRESEWALTISHFVKLVSVPEDKLRDELTQLAMDNRWSSHRLQSEIVARLTRRKHGGRKPTKVGADYIGAELSRVVWSWEHWIKTNAASFTGLYAEVQAEVDLLNWQIERIQRLMEKTQPRTKPEYTSDMLFISSRSCERSTMDLQTCYNNRCK